MQRALGKSHAPLFQTLADSADSIALPYTGIEFTHSIPVVTASDPSGFTKRATHRQEDGSVVGVSEAMMLCVGDLFV